MSWPVKRAPSGKGMFDQLAVIPALAGWRLTARFAGLSALAAACEGLGLVLLVPLLGSMGAGSDAATMRLPDWSLGALLWVFVALVGLRAWVETMRSLASFDLQVRVVDGLRKEAVRAVLGAEWRAVSNMRQSANRALLITSIDRAGDAVSYLAAVLRTAISLLALLAAAMVLAPLFALGGAVVGLLALALLGSMRSRARKLGALLSIRQEKIHLGLEEALSAVRLIKSFGREKSEAGRIEDNFTALRGTEREFLRDSAIARGMLQLAMAGVLAGAVWVAVELWQVAPAYLLAFAALAIRAVPLLEALQHGWQGWCHSAPAIAEAKALIGLARQSAEEPPEPVGPMQREIALLEATVAHGEGRNALSKVSLAVPRGVIAAVHGASGAGKSTVADLLGGLATPDRGAVLLDGVPLTDGRRNGWRARVAYVQQDPVLFAGSIRQNLAWASEGATEGDLVRALDRASAGFVHELPGGLDYELAEKGANLSGGERQRLALARALLRNPDLLILDEATSAVDHESEQVIVQAICALAGEVTVLVIGHRGALVDAAHLRFHLRDGALRKG